MRLFAALVAGLALGALLFGCTSGSDGSPTSELPAGTSELPAGTSEPPAGTSEPPAGATVSATPGSSATAPPAVTREPTATPTTTPTPVGRGITGMSGPGDGGNEPIEVRSLGPEPESPFEPWNGEDVVLYDTLTMTETNLGPGAGLGLTFSPDGTRFTWTAAGRGSAGIWVLDLETGERTRLSDGRVLRWLDDETLYGFPRAGSNERGRLDVASGEWSSASDVDPNDFSRPELTDRWILEAAPLDEVTYPHWSRPFTLLDRSGELPPLAFEAAEAALSSDGMLFLATTPANPSQPIENGPHIEVGTTTIFEVDPVTAVATFIATAEASAPNWAFDASERHVGWMDGFCGEFNEARTVLYDRESGAFVAIDQAMWFEFTPDGRVADGSFGARRLLDPDTLETVVVLPNVSDVSWSADFRYAAVGTQLGHGGLC